MTPDINELLPAAKARQVNAWLDEVHVVQDLSWDLTDTKVLHLRSGGRQFIAKTGGAGNHHLDREIEAHANYTTGLKQRGLAAQQHFVNKKLRLMILGYQLGTIAAGTAAEFDPGIHRQAGAAVRILHVQGQRLDEHYERQLTEKIRHLLAQEHRIDKQTRDQVQRLLEAYAPQPAMLVPTHGDWQPRNWLVDHGKLRAIDFGRFDFRPAASDLARLAMQQWKGHLELEASFLHGYGDDPRKEPAWQMMKLREAIGTAVWAYQVGDEGFEAQGHRMLADCLEQF